MQEGWLLHRSIHQQRSTPFLDKTRRQTGPESPLPSPWCPHRLQGCGTDQEPGCLHPPSTMNSLFHVQNRVQQCYHITQVKYFQFLLCFSPTHRRTEDLEFQKLCTKARGRNPSDAGVKNLSGRGGRREGLKPHMVFWFLCATAEPPVQSRSCVCLGLLAQLQLAGRGR